jgi:RNA polymerase sigma-70 factor (ECF subfamily)
MTSTVVDERQSQLLRELHDKYAWALLSYVVGLTGGDRWKAQDVVQETMLRAWRNPDVLEQVDGYRRGWLFTVAKRIVIDDWRASRRHPEVVTDQLPEPSVDDAAQQTVDGRLVRDALRTLSGEHRQVLFEAYFRGATVAEAAETLNVPPGTIKSRSHYALHALRQALHDMGAVAQTTGDNTFHGSR